MRTIARPLWPAALAPERLLLYSCEREDTYLVYAREMHVTRVRRNKFNSPRFTRFSLKILFRSILRGSLNFLQRQIVLGILLITVVTTFHPRRKLQNWIETEMSKNLEYYVFLCKSYSFKMTAPFKTVISTPVCREFNATGTPEAHISMAYRTC